MLIDRRYGLAGAATTAIAVVAPSVAGAAGFPVRPIRMIIPFPAGGPTDLMGRVVADFMTRDLGQTVVIDNRGGANGSLGAEATAKADPDGYTILMTAGSVLVQNPLVYKKLAYDPARDFRILGLMTEVPLVIVVHPSLSIGSVADLIAYAKANPGKLAFGSPGTGSTAHLAGERFKYATGAEMTHIPYKGTAPALADLVAGHIQVMFDTLSTSIPHIKAGALRAVAMATPKRLDTLPDIPTAAESGVPDLVISVWFGAAGPAAMADDVAAILTASLYKAAADPAVRSKLEGIGYVVMPPRDEAAMKQFVADDRAGWAKVVAARNITVE